MKTLSNCSEDCAHSATESVGSIVDNEDRSSSVSSSEVETFESSSFENGSSNEILKAQNYIYSHSDFSHRGMIHKPKSSSNGSSILWQFIKQLQPQTDLMRMCSPVFLLRPISTLELYTYYTEPTVPLKLVQEFKYGLDRMLNCLLFSLISCSNTFGDSFEGLKPYNPILGEEFHAEWKSSTSNENSTSYGWLESWIKNQSQQAQERISKILNESKTKITAEQVSHHPPISSFMMVNEECGWKMNSTFQIIAKLKMNYVDLNIAGKHLLSVIPSHVGETEDYEFTLPHMYANGLFWGSSNVTNGECLKIKCKQTGLNAKLSFSSGNDVSGSITDCNGKTLFKLKGNICEKITISKEKNYDSNLHPSDLIPNMFNPQTTSADFFNATKTLTYTNDLIVKPVQEQRECESRRVWHKVTYDILHGNKDAFTHKHEVEEAQRTKAALNKNEGRVYETKLFKPSGKFTKKHDIPIYEYKVE